MIDNDRPAASIAVPLPHKASIATATRATKASIAMVHCFYNSYWTPLGQVLCCAVSRALMEGIRNWIIHSFAITCIKPLFGTNGSNKQAGSFPFHASSWTIACPQGDGNNGFASATITCRDDRRSIRSILPTIAIDTDGFLCRSFAL
jgi:hypothetical protein